MDRRRSSRYRKSVARRSSSGSAGRGGNLDEVESRLLRERSNRCSRGWRFSKGGCTRVSVRSRLPSNAVAGFPGDSLASLSLFLCLSPRVRVSSGRFSRSPTLILPPVSFRSDEHEVGGGLGARARARAYTRLDLHRARDNSHEWDPLDALAPSSPEMPARGSTRPAVLVGSRSTLDRSATRDDPDPSGGIRASKRGRDSRGRDTGECRWSGVDRGAQDRRAIDKVYEDRETQNSDLRNKIGPWLGTRRCAEDKSFRKYVGDIRATIRDEHALILDLRIVQLENRIGESLTWTSDSVIDVPRHLDRYIIEENGQLESVSRRITVDHVTSAQAFRRFQLIYNISCACAVFRVPILVLTSWRFNLMTYLELDWISWWDDRTRRLINSEYRRIFRVLARHFGTRCSLKATARD